MYLGKEHRVFEGRNVAVGVTNIYDKTKLFFYYGRLLEINERRECVLLKLKNQRGFLEIDFHRIKDIHLAKEERR